MGLDAHALGLISPLFTLATREARSAIFEEGDECDSVFILLSGSVEVVKSGTLIATLDGAATAVGEGHPFFGTAGVLELGARRPWDVYTRTPCSLLELSMRTFKAFLRTEPDFRQRLNDYSETRRRQWELETGLSLPIPIHHAPASAAAAPGDGQSALASPRPSEGTAEMADVGYEAAPPPPLAPPQG